MTKYSIHNNINNADFVQYGTTFTWHPEYGQLDRWVPTSQVSPLDQSRVQATRPAPTLAEPDATESYLPADYTVTAADATAELQAQAMTAIRAQRDALMAKCDFTQLADCPMDSATKQNWRTYRQALRDLPGSITDVNNVTWPTPPSELK